MEIKVDLSNADYHGDKGFLSSSSLKMLLKNPQEFYESHILKIPKEKEDKGFFDEGSYLHSLILEPEKTKDDFKIFPGFMRRGAEWDQFKASLQPGQIGISKPQHLKVMKWYEAYKRNKIATMLINKCLTEHSLFLSLHNVPIKVRADAINIEEGYIIDIKTSGFDSNLDGFKFAMNHFGYPLSASLYIQSFEKYYGKKFDFYFIVVGKKDNICKVFKLSDETKNLGDMEVFKAIELYKACLEKNEWTLNTKCDILQSEDIQEV